MTYELEQDTDAALEELKEILDETDKLKKKTIKDLNKIKITKEELDEVFNNGL